MENNRRNFLKVAGASALGLAVSAAGSLKPDSTHIEQAAPAPAYIPPTLPKSAAQWAMVIDTKKLQSAGALKPIIEACQKAHNIPSIKNKKHEIKWIWKEGFHNAFPDQVNKYMAEGVEHGAFPVLCNHCENPPCVKACPTKATFKRQDGIVMMDYHRCIGCRFCMVGCPYGARSFNFMDPRPHIDEKDFNPGFPTRMQGVVEKCNFCAERIGKGLLPACVEAAKGAILFGDLGDANSDVRQALKSNYTLRRKPSLGTEPAVYYIV